MWDKIARELKKYDSAVLTAGDPQGYPFSVRCLPAVDAHAHVLRVHAPPGVLLQAGPASLLCHRHNELLWDMQSFLIRGVLAQDEQGWSFRPRRFIPGTPGSGPGALLPSVRWLLNSRRSAARYLKKRQLPRARIPWDEIRALKTLAQRTSQHVHKA